jgi:hypothetical protein
MKKNNSANIFGHTGFAQEQSWDRFLDTDPEPQGRTWGRSLLGLKDRCYNIMPTSRLPTVKMPKFKRS